MMHEDKKHRHEHTKLFQKRLAELNLTILSCGPNGSFSLDMANLVEEWATQYARKKTSSRIDPKPEIVGLLKVECRQECYRSLHFAGLAGAADHLFQRARIHIGDSGNAVKQRFESYKSNKLQKASNLIDETLIDDPEVITSPHMSNSGLPGTEH